MLAASTRVRRYVAGWGISRCQCPRAARLVLPVCARPLLLHLLQRRIITKTAVTSIRGITIMVTTTTVTTPTMFTTTIPTKTATTATTSTATLKTCYVLATGTSNRTHNLSLTLMVLRLPFSGQR